MDGWNTIVSFRDGLFSGTMLVSGRVIAIYIYIASLTRDPYIVLYVNPKWVVVHHPKGPINPQP